jgi:putative ABC transport system ATP-binding protein
MATFGPAKILLLDEHTAALDPGAAELVMQLTDDIVRQFEITTIMVTHSMRQALDHGSRILMLHQGSIMLDISGPERASITLEQLLALFKRKEGRELADDQLLLD